MKNKHIIFCFLFLSLYLLSFSKPINISGNFNNLYLDKINSIERELIDIFSDEYSYQLTNDGTRSFTSLDSEGNFLINLINDDEFILRHELFHLYYFNHLIKNNISLNSLPVWVHEFGAVWFEQKNILNENFYDLRDYYYNFFKFENEYPPLSEDRLFYRNLNNFAFYISKKIPFEIFLERTTESYLKKESVKEAFYYALDDKLIFLKWNIYRISKSIFFWIFVIIILVSLCWRIILYARNKSKKN